MKNTTQTTNDDIKIGDVVRSYDFGFLQPDGSRGPEFSPDGNNANYIEGVITDKRADDDGVERYHIKVGAAVIHGQRIDVDHGMTYPPVNGTPGKLLCDCHDNRVYSGVERLKMN